MIQHIRKEFENTRRELKEIQHQFDRCLYGEHTANEIKALKEKYAQ